MSVDPRPAPPVHPSRRPVLLQRLSLYYDGDEADRYGFLCGLLAVIKHGLPCGGPPPGSFARLEIDPAAGPDEIAFGRLVTAYINDDSSGCLDLWAVYHQDDHLSGHVMALAIEQAGAFLRAGQS